MIEQSKMNGGIPLLPPLLFLLAVVAHQRHWAANGAALPGPPVFEAISHYPSFCYLPPESGLCSSSYSSVENNETIDNLAEPKKSFPPSDANDVDENNNNSNLKNRLWEDDSEMEGGGNGKTNGNHGKEEQQQKKMLTRYYFDSITAQCYPFGAQQCGGNQNRFESQAECLARCKME